MASSSGSWRPRKAAAVRLGVFYFHLVIEDVDPYRFFGPAFDHHAVPTRKLQGSPESSTQIAPPEFTGGIRFRGKPADAHPSRAWNPGGSQRADHEGNDVPGIVGMLQVPFTRCNRQIPEKGRSDAVATPERLVLPRIDNPGLFCAQVNPEYLSCIPVCHILSPCDRLKEHTDTV